MYASLSWVPRGHLRACPTIYHPSREDEQKAKRVLQEMREAMTEEQESDSDIDNMSDVLDSEEKDEPAPHFNDKYVVVREESDCDDEQLEDFKLINSDNMLVGARTMDLSYIDCLVYNSETNDFYLHHNMISGVMPLSVVYFDFVPQGDGAAGNYCAISGFSSEIEIWDLDVLDAIAPVAVLGGTQVVTLRPKGPGFPKRKKEFPLPGSHKDHILSLAWSSLHRNILASASADMSIKIWDLNKLTCLYTFEGLHSNGPISSIAFHPTHPGILASVGLGDRRIVLIQASSGQTAEEIVRLEADPEQLAWLGEDLLCCTTELGEICVISVVSRAIVCVARPLEEVSVGKQTPLTALSCHPTIPYILAVGSPENTHVALCQYTSEAREIRVLTVRDVSLPVFSLAWCGGQEAHALALGSNQSRTRVLQPFSWLEYSLLTSLGVPEAYGTHKECVAKIIEDDLDDSDD
ncbi:WD40 repeat protein [Giardia muris]|uniref:WD40 repeat protein n=1 Tax=Giardia muris TaxID=5742 RepID=A0A4Z1SPD2_GIAMU|nr:WD40 repeat protein [Giardia muris]|eukprot:TNJ27500.1 WD40 repeat protein [Giardia muris]